MSYLIVVFAGRRDAIAFYDTMLSYGVRSEIINTPRSLKMSCGISVKIPLQAEVAARSIVMRSSSFSGMYFFSNGKVQRIF